MVYIAIGTERRDSYCMPSPVHIVVAPVVVQAHPHEDLSIQSVLVEFEHPSVLAAQRELEPAYARLSVWA
jgi:hypothetical protein